MQNILVIKSITTGTKNGNARVIHVSAKDACPGMIDEAATMAIKNCLSVHDQIYL